MTRAYVPLLLFVAAIWGASFMFIKVAVGELEPTTLMALRLLLSAAPLFVVLAVRRGLAAASRDVGAVWRAALVLGIVNSAVPFTLIAWGEKHVDSGVAAIVNSTVPIFVALLAIRFRESERVSGLRLAGVLLGLVGVAVLAGGQPEGGSLAVAGTLACTAAAFLYAVGALYGQTKMERVDALTLLTASTLAGGLFLLPAGALQAPGELPSGEVIGSVLALSLLATVVGLLVYYHLLATYGSLRASLVVYLIPPSALVYGALLLDEEITLAAAAGLALILVGVALGSGVVQTLRRRVPAAVGAP